MSSHHHSHAHSHSQGQATNGTSTSALASGVIRPWDPAFQPGNTSFQTLDGRPVSWNGGWAGIAGEAAGTQQAPPPLQLKQGNTTGPTYLPFPELTCLHCLGSNPPGKLGYVVSYLPVVPTSTNGQQPSSTTATSAAPANAYANVNGNGIGNGKPQSQSVSQVQNQAQEAHDDSDTSHGEGQDGYHPLPVRSPAPSQSSLIASRTGRESFRSDQRARRARSRAEERVQDIERGRQLEKDEQAERARSSSVSWDLAGVAKQYVPDGEEEDAVIE